MSGFKTKARTVELLGRKQIRDSVTALAELMKNAYDADAPWLRVEFDTSSSNQHVVIADRGLGMSKSDIENKWLVLGTNSKNKSTNKTSPSGRPLMGAKGIGRLASATLGTQLWMFTKTENNNWNIVFVNWDVFENPYISMDQVKIPTKFDITKEELLLRFEDISKEMIQEQIENLNNDLWEEDSEGFVVPLKVKIIESINRKVDKSILTKYISAFDSGTILFINNLHDDWNKYISPMSAEKRKEDTMVEKMYNRFASFISMFRHTNTTKIPFEVEIYIDGEPWKEDYDFIDEDYEIYDIKVEGKIKHGRFTGKLYANNADKELLRKCNQDLSSGIDVTTGIKDWEMVDCGEFSIKFCHIEGVRKSSGLSNDDYSRIKRKLETTCGICIYRDGVRVLPYGEPENDFLNIEERRTLKASTYIFSHRNIFGRIDIDSKNNPMLEDKSSREGLIENPYYFYFVKTLENLLTILAVNYLSSVRNDSLGIRDTYTKSNENKAAAAEARRKYQKEEQAQIKKLLSEASSWCKNTENALLHLLNSINQQCDNIQKQVEECDVESGYEVLAAQIDAVKIESLICKDQITETINSKYAIPSKYLTYFSEELLSEIKRCNLSINEVCSSLMAHVDQTVKISLDYLNDQIEKWMEQLTELFHSDPQSIKNSLLSRLGDIVDGGREKLEHIISEDRKNRNNLMDEMSPIVTLIADINNMNSPCEKETWRNADLQIKKIAELKSRIDLLFDSTPAEVVHESNEIISLLDQYNSELFIIIQKAQYEVNNSFAKLQKEAIGLLHYSQTDSENVSEQQIIDLLRYDNIQLAAELEIYSDLANMGLASEIVNHEFNQLFVNVNNAIKNMVPYVKEPAAKYWLKQIDMGFRSISDRQNQLSPMYRSYSLKKTAVNLKSFIEEIRRFTEGELERNDVELVNDIDEDIVVKISKSKIFPAISNLINNSIFWVLNSTNRIIRISYDDESRSLFIEDSGAGIAALDKEKIFEPFVSFKPNGRGLGLTVARKVLESQGHQLLIASDEEKTLSGACFKIVFSDDVLGGKL